jgi:uncharacterized protein (DUF362 family)
MIHQNNKNETMVCIQNSTYESIDIDSLLNPLGTLKKYINKGDRVLLKLNLLNASTPEKRVTTDPSIVKKTAEAVLKTGGIPFIGDSPSGQFTKRRLKKVYKKAGLLELSHELGIELNYNTRTTKVPIPNGKLLKKTTLCDFILQADKIIAIPKIKTHSYMIMTLATKIMYGSIPGLNKAKYHSLYIKRSSFADILIDTLSITKPDLIIMDGIIGMQGNGPAGGTAVKLKILLASENAYAMDITVCKILNIEPVGIPILKQAKVRDLWPKEIIFPLLKPDDVKYTKFILPSTAGYILTGRKTPQRLPKITQKCTSCGLCQEICPKNAIKNKLEGAEIYYNKCIRCYCCHEICPENAIALDIII